MPETYQLKVGLPGSEAYDTITAHYTRCVHITRELLESEIEGVPSLQQVYNRLMDIEKLVGGSAEMFWRGARPGLKSKADEGYELDEQTIENLKDQLSEYEHDLRRFFTLSGVDVETLQQQVSDPSNHLDIQIQMLSALTGIPKRILTGSERGELASSQDRAAWLEMIQSRREEFAETKIIKPFVDKMVEFGILPEVENYDVKWKDLFAPSEKEKADVAKVKSDALKQYADSGAAMLMPFDKFLTMVLDYTQEQADEITESYNDQISEEQQFDLNNPENSEE